MFNDVTEYLLVDARKASDTMVVGKASDTMVIRKASDTMLELTAQMMLTSIQ